MINKYLSVGHYSQSLFLEESSLEEEEDEE